MAAYLLRPRDGARDIKIPAGKTTIGRGPFLGVTDKRVSRSHAVLELKDGELTILPLHTNPTFYKASVTEKFAALKKNEIQNLASGNVISLLPDALCFEVICEGTLTLEEASTPKEISTEDFPSADTNEKAKANSKESSESFLDEFMDIKPALEAKLHVTAKASCGSDDGVESPMLKTSGERTASPSKPQIEPAQPLQKTRRLPSWLMESTSSEARSSLKKEGNRKGKAPAASKAGKATQMAALKMQKKQARTDSADEEIIGSDDVDEKDSGSLKAKGRSTKQKKRTSADMQESDNDTKPTVCKKTKPAAACVNEDSSLATAKTKPVKLAKQVTADELSNESEEDAKPAVSKKRQTKATDPDKDKSEDSILPPCPYGSECYRKNPVHFKEYSHSEKDSKGESDKAAGDSDGDDDDEDDDVRQECPYGTTCYRKNPQHRKEFKHSKAPDRPKRSKSKRKSVVANKSDDDGPNTYDYNDSFIDDADEEDDSSYSAGSDDSDWKPQGGDDNDDDDDVDELLTEAHGFLRSKKMAKPV